ncbi:3-oxoacyl-[acyl-carrier-protein] synthase III C-terminal domain-containing protein [Kitasatospora sp. MAP5-34]|uniref:3-oxoacyl-[acyl-carrier-protein] synthase III C-terminal domain-containing protein n=1 Tax=Kitasatospora sp. MAP5-34 TaxID=3035102 RepID=UPI002476DDD6|nr:3-oxoacyl-[acyl-carrier-protein] synthase III C-terminal domain-containing protein [Kitasatospora sp. MAP5-34]MDH6577755.1 hypothetical protein [Kitasatospora sp. MAP5-34]
MNGRAVRESDLPGDRVMLIAFGAGLTWGSTVVTWTGTTNPARSPLPPDANRQTGPTREDSHERPR